MRVPKRLAIATELLLQGKAVLHISDEILKIAHMTPMSPQTLQTCMEQRVQKIF